MYGVFQEKTVSFLKLLPTTQAPDHEWSNADPWCGGSISLYSLLLFLSAAVDYSVRKGSSLLMRQGSPWPFCCSY